MRYRIPLLAVSAIALSTAVAQADFGDQLFKLLPDDSAVGDWFGRPVAISGTTAIVGAFWDDDNGTNSGSAYLFDAAGASACPADLDGDGNVDATDLAMLLTAWGPCPPKAECPADIGDCDGVVGPFDLATLLGNWGPCEP